MYEQIEKSKENKNSAVANSVAQKKSGNDKASFQFVDNRFEAVGQRKLRDMITNKETAQRAFEGKGGVTQLLKVSDDHVRADLNHKDRDKLFTDNTFQDILPRVGLVASSQLGTGAVSNAILDVAVNASRAAGQMDYKQLSQEKVSSEKQMTIFLQKNEDDEHMYVLDGSDLHVAIRTEDKKLPHPTLVGGDPDVECAGTLRFESEDVIVTCSSGHFRPPTEGKGKKMVEKMMRKTGTTTYNKSVKGKRR